MTNRKHEAFDARVYEAVPEGRSVTVGVIHDAVKAPRFIVDRALRRLKAAGKVHHVKGPDGGWKRVEAVAARKSCHDCGSMVRERSEQYEHKPECQHAAPAVVIAATSADAETIMAHQRAILALTPDGRAQLALSRATVVDGAALREMAERLATANDGNDWQTVDDVRAELRALVGGDNG